MSQPIHRSVLLDEVSRYLDPKPDENFIDCTIDGGGHSAAILEKNGPRGKILGIDQDQKILEAARTKFQANGERLILVNDNFANLKNIVEKYKFGPIHGILLDLGMSTWHIQESGRGFSFTRNEPLIMRYDQTGLHRNQISNIKNQNYNSKLKNYEKDDLTAEEIVNNWPEEKIIFILKEYGEERFAEKIAKNIVIARKIEPINTTFQLVEIIKKSVPAEYLHGRIHPATRVFQALRIAVNDELENLRKVLPEALDVLDIGGRLVVISFHSLEDRIAKNFFRDKAREGLLSIATKNPVTPQIREIKENSAARSAKLRAAVKL